MHEGWNKSESYGGGVAIAEAPRAVEHLIEGVNPIIACIGSFDDFKKAEQTEDASEYIEHLSKNFGLENLKNIDFDRPVRELEKNRSMNAGYQTYVISQIDNFNKFSKGFYRCTGLVVTGIDKQTGKNISFLSHQDPMEFLSPDKKGIFSFHLAERLDEMKRKCKRDTIDAVIVGGVYLDDKASRELYTDSVELLKKEVKKKLGFNPEVIDGPKTEIGGKTDDVYYDNDRRRLYFVRPKVGNKVLADESPESGR